MSIWFWFMPTTTTLIARESQSKIDSASLELYLPCQESWTLRSGRYLRRHKRPRNPRLHPDRRFHREPPFRLRDLGSRDTYPSQRSLPTPLLSGVLEIADCLFLLGIDAYDRLTFYQMDLDLIVEMEKLGMVTSMGPQIASGRHCSGSIGSTIGDFTVQLE